MKNQRKKDGTYHGKNRAFVHPDSAFLFIEMDRKTGRVVDIDEEFCFPTETLTILTRALKQVEEREDD